MKELKALRDKATQGEWKIDYISEDRKIHHLQDMNDKFISNIEDIASAEYIAALHNANLIDRVEELEELEEEEGVWEESAIAASKMWKHYRKENKALKAQLASANKLLRKVNKKTIIKETTRARFGKKGEIAIVAHVELSKDIEAYLQALTTKPKEKEGE